MTDRLNIIFILADDLGWMDLSAQGSTFYETPHLDALARRGMSFTDAYASCPVCSPTRASILTGRYPARVGVTNYIDSRLQNHPARGVLIDAPYIPYLPPGEHNLARALQAGGYATWHVGKWHLGGPPCYPRRQGFDVNIGGAQNGMPVNGYFSPWNLENLENSPEGEYLDDRLAAEAVRLIAERDRQRPFFLNFWPYLVHTPIQGKPEKVAKYAAKAKEMGLDQQETFVEGDFFPCEHKKTGRIQRRQLQSDPAYAAMVESLDEAVGRIVDTLEAEGIADQTVIVFTSDNGGLSTAEGAPTCNAPLAEGKGWMYEGGVREPLFIAWPGMTPPGSTCAEPVTSPDFYPTLLEAAGLDPIPEQHVDGVSLKPLLQGGGSLDREAIFWHFPHYGNQGGTPACSVRMGPWKLIEFFEYGRLELYHLGDDISEQRDLAAQEPERVRAMHARLRVWQDEVSARRPAYNPDFMPWSGAHEALV